MTEYKISKFFTMQILNHIFYETGSCGTCKLNLDDVSQIEKDEWRGRNGNQTLARPLKIQICFVKWENWTSQLYVEIWDDSKCKERFYRISCDSEHSNCPLAQWGAKASVGSSLSQTKPVILSGAKTLKKKNVIISVSCIRGTGLGG